MIEKGSSASPPVPREVSTYLASLFALGFPPQFLDSGCLSKSVVREALIYSHPKKRRDCSNAVRRTFLFWAASTVRRGKGMHGRGVSLGPSP